MSLMDVRKYGLVELPNIIKGLSGEPAKPDQCEQSKDIGDCHLDRLSIFGKVVDIKKVVKSDPRQNTDKTEYSP